MLNGPMLFTGSRGFGSGVQHLDFPECWDLKKDGLDSYGGLLQTKR